MHKPPAVILAGGKATRMGGGDKPLMHWRGRPLIEHVLEGLAGQVGEVAINAGGDPARYTDYGEAIADSLPDCGPLSGILTALEWAVGNEVLVVAGDTVPLPPDLVARLDAPSYAASLVDGEWRAHPTVGLWPTRLAPHLRAYLESGERRVMGWARQVGAQEIRFEGEVFRNFNTPKDLES